MIIDFKGRDRMNTKLKSIIIGLSLLTSFEPAFALVKHFTIAPPFTIESVEADTNNPNFSVIKTSDHTFDLFNDYNNESTFYASIKLWVANKSTKNYAWFVEDKLGVQFLDCTNCNGVKKVDADNYQLAFI